MGEGHYCYVLVNDRGHTYTGYTVNTERRLRQHNGELVGGARSTRGRGPWRFLFTVTAPELDRNSGLSLEWWLKHPTGQRRRPRIYEGVEGRWASLEHVLQQPRFRDFSWQVEKGT